jgi:hypothetical protein
LNSLILNTSQHFSAVLCPEEITTFRFYSDQRASWINRKSQ